MENANSAGLARDSTRPTTDRELKLTSLAVLAKPAIRNLMDQFKAKKLRFCIRRF